MESKMNSTAMMRKKNLLKIIEVVLGNPYLSRPEIARMVGLTGMTVNTLVAELERRNIVVQKGLQDSKGGRKALLYNINCKSKTIVGVTLQIEQATVDIFDLCGRKTAEGIVLPLHAGEQIERDLSRIVAAIRKITSGSTGNREDILGVGMAVPGRVDCRNGIVYNLTNMPRWRNVPLKEMLEKELGMPVFVERDTYAHLRHLRLSAQAEDRGDVPNMVYLAIDEGIGAGVILDNRVYHGSHGLAGEVGHISLDPDGPPCNCGNRGCTEVYASHDAIIRNYARNLKKMSLEDAEVGNVLGRRSLENKFILDLARKAADGDAAADHAFQVAVRYLAACIINIINMYDPSLIVIECKWMRMARKYFHMVVSSVFQGCRLFNRNDVEIVLNPVEDIFESSSYAVVMDRMLTEPDGNALIG